MTILLNVNDNTDVTKVEEFQGTYQEFKLDFKAFYRIKKELATEMPDFSEDMNVGMFVAGLMTDDDNYLEKAIKFLLGRDATELDALNVINNEMLSAELSDIDPLDAVEQLRQRVIGEYQSSGFFKRSTSKSVKLFEQADEALSEDDETEASLKKQLAVVISETKDFIS